MSSRKERQPTRKVEPPDWASDVKPDEDVMAMFYAPTGQPKAGPLLPLSTSASETDSESIRTPEPSSTANNLEPGLGINTNLEREPSPMAPDSELRTVDDPQQERFAEPVTEIVGTESLMPARQEEELVEAGDATTSLPTILPDPIPEQEADDASGYILVRDEEDGGSPNPTTTRQESKDPSLVSSQSREFEDYFGQWLPFLTKGQAKVLHALFEMTYVVGREECLTSNAQLAAAADMSLRQTALVVQDLEQLGFLSRPETFNTRTRKGTIFRLFLTRQDASPRKRRQYHLEDR